MAKEAPLKKKRVNFNGKRFMLGLKKSLALEPALPRKEFELFENDMVRLRGFFSGKSPATLPILPAGPPAAPQLRTQLASRLTSGQKYRMRGMEIFLLNFFLTPINTIVNIANGKKVLKITIYMSGSLDQFYLLRLAYKLVSRPSK